MLFLVVLIVGFCFGDGVLRAEASIKSDAYKAEAALRTEEATHLQKGFEGEVKDKALEAQRIIQTHLNGESLKAKTPCLASNGSELNSEHAEEGCKVYPAQQKFERNATTPESTPPITNTDQLIVFVSFSMPEESLKALFEALEINPDVKLVLRGLIDDSMDKTARKINDLGGVLEINPELFDRYQIQQVPTFVMVKGDGTTLKLAGNITLNHARERFHEAMSQKQRSLEKTS